MEKCSKLQNNLLLKKSGGISKLTLDMYMCEKHFKESRKKSSEVDSYFLENEKKGVVECAPRNCRCDVVGGKYNRNRCKNKAIAVIKEKLIDPDEDEYMLIDSIRIRSVA